MEMFGKVMDIPQTEKTFYPRSPCGVSKVFAHWITTNYREAYGMLYVTMYIVMKVQDGETFVTRKVTITLSKLNWSSKKL